MIERWVAVEGWPYEVSSLGRVRRALRHRYLNSRPFGILSGSPARHGYLKVTLSDTPRQRTALIHHLVCVAFHGPKPSPRHHAAHGNGINTDNRAVNLRWATPEENERDKVFHGRDNRGSRHPGAKLREDDVLAIRALLRTRRFTQGEIAEMFGVNKSKISHIATGRSWRHVPVS